MGKFLSTTGNVRGIIATTEQTGLTFQNKGLMFPNLQSEMNPPTEKPVTRAKNVNQRPGLAIPKRKQRTKGEIEHDRALEEEEKQAKAKKGGHSPRCVPRR